MRGLAIKFGRALRHDGPRATIWAAYRHLQFRRLRYREGAIDRKFGTDTGGFIPLAELNIDSPNVAHGVHFEPVTRAYFERMLAAAQIKPEHFTFVDLGCGKGRALLFAAQHPFARLVGVEFSSLAEIAQDNVRKFLAVTGEEDRFEIRQMDAVDFAFPTGPIVLFLYNPFGEPVLARVIENLSSSLEREPRELAILYRTPEWRSLFDALPFLTLAAADDGWRVYRSCASAGSA